MLFLLLFFAQGFSDCNPQANSCGYYDQCLERAFPCEDNGYSLSYGKKYCQKYLSLNTENSVSLFSLSPKGKIWRDHTLLCLQEELHKQWLGSGFASCEDLTQYAFDSHPGCYTQSNPSFCDLKYSDWLLVTSVVDGRDLFSLKSAKQISKVALTCSTHIIRSLEKTDQLLRYKSQGPLRRERLLSEKKDLELKLEYIQKLKKQNSSN
ncbi:MAG: hypothetical protein KDD37_03515 [Bdellovibrionales bacterium]|nr:hypothetical protein [Bdellovibrionales bacterium]